MIYRVYELVDPINNIPFYVGATKLSLKNRLYTHLNDFKVSKKKNTPSDKRKLIIKGIIDAGHKPIIRLLEETTKDHIGELEKMYYSIYVSQGVILFQSNNHFSYNERLKNKGYDDQESKTYQMYAEDHLVMRIERQPEIKEMKISLSKTCLILIKEALNAREAKKNKK